uniref:Uncharacterized protein n=1 Tax=Arundo donax TaxID=35708 RepID=A0A0A9ET12_ARUDO
MFRTENQSAKLYLCCQNAYSPANNLKRNTMHIQ